MKKIFTKNHLFPSLLLLSFTADILRYFNLIFTSEFRWIILFISFLFVISHVLFKQIVSLNVLQITLIYAFWSILTYFWSENPQLSIMKATALLLVIVAAVGYGYIFIFSNTIENALDYMFPMVLTVAVGAFLGQTNVTTQEGLTFFSGGTSNPNEFGALCAMSIPFALWKYENSKKDYLRILSGIACIFFTILVVISNSRNAIIVMICINIGLFWKNKTSIHLGIYYKILIGSVIILVLFPGLFGTSLHDIIYKGKGKSNLTSSRDIVWEESYSQAKKGGIIGGGYGVTIGTETQFEGNLNASGYGREKGNSQFGIMEETGIIGLIIYIISTIMIYYVVIKKWQMCMDIKQKKLLGIIIGLLFGFLFSSMVEGWYNAPGSSECIYYWFVIGTALGLVKKKYKISAPSSILMKQRNKKVKHYLA